ncbi:MAG TPA: 2Fe-2S ferredoxin [Syntrophomonadaceae bacterium]|nr:2Fe-2S ferredoxin [Syntrophomonadaceae bacterium]
MEKPKYHVFVCSSSRVNGLQQGFCYGKESVAIVQAFVETLEERDMDGEVMVTNTGCFGICNSGPIAVVYPDGVWYNDLTVDDVEEIVESHFENGQKVARLEIT